MFGTHRIYRAEATETGGEGGGSGEGSGEPTGAAARAVAGAAGGGETQAQGDLPEWASAFPDELAGRVREAKWQTPEDMARSYDSLLAMKGAPADRLMKLPGPAESDEAKAYMAKALGAPENPEEYQFEGLEVPEGIPNLSEALRGAFHEARLPKDSAPGVVKAVTDALGGLKRIEGEEADARFAKASENLSQRWGGESDQRWRNVSRGYDLLGLPDEQADALARQMGEEAFFLRMEDLGRRMGEPATHGRGGSGAAVTTVTREQAEARLKEITSNPQHYDLSNPEVRAEIDRMAKIAHPGTVEF